MTLRELKIALRKTIKSSNNKYQIGKQNMTVSIEEKRAVVDTAASLTV